MKRRSFLETIVKSGAAIIVGISCGGLNQTDYLPLQELLANNQYDYSPFLIDLESGLEELQTCVNEVTVQHSYQVNESDFYYLGGRIYGSATVIAKDFNDVYLLTNDHVVAPFTNEEVIRNESSIIRQEMRLASYRPPNPNELSLTFSEFIIQLSLNNSEDESVPAEIVMRDPEMDLVLLRLSSLASDRIEQVQLCPPFGNDQEIRVGHQLYISGFGGGRGNRLLSGIASGYFARRSEHQYEVSDANVTSGHSGGAVFALRDGSPELVGIVNLNENRMYTGFIGISAVSNWLESRGWGHLLEP